MIEWHDPKVKLPNDGDECLLMPLDHGGLTTVSLSRNISRGRPSLSTYIRLSAWCWAWL